MATVFILLSVIGKHCPWVLDCPSGSLIQVVTDVNWLRCASLPSPSHLLRGPDWPHLDLVCIQLQKFPFSNQRRPI